MKKVRCFSIGLKIAQSQRGSLFINAASIKCSVEDDERKLCYTTKISLQKKNRLKKQKLRSLPLLSSPLSLRCPSSFGKESRNKPKKKKKGQHTKKKNDCTPNIFFCFQMVPPLSTFIRMPYKKQSISSFAMLLSLSLILTADSGLKRQLCYNIHHLAKTKKPQND